VETLANRFPGDANLAVAQSTAGALALAESRYGDALRLLREAGRRWQLVHAPLEVAKVRLLVAKASAALGDDETAALERSSAQSTLAELGVPARFHGEHAAGALRPLPAGISEREAQVLVLLASGKTNREIGDTLFISPRTVARHLENIYAKLSVSTRSAAAAWAAAHALHVRPDGANDPRPGPVDWVD
jgi:DNA-binding CsgD family transcriptional regulator